ncbi:hypothetical protein NIES4071_03210 [Calothrix sp. NIES-4071]|nr:hypothetical protein NIES4071_03210 [Calothrix sp. NIES-4071]BAZ54667.1 hypothetical protein NIES4105_03200 [Calothrix sp. NIES-4105]
MKYDEFIKHVQNEAGLSSRDEAINATRATLETIRERIVGDEAKDLASQLPKELGEYLHGREGENGAYFKCDEFIKKVSEREGVSTEVATKHARAIFSVLESAVSAGEFEDVRLNFSDDYSEILPAVKNEVNA